MDRPSPPLRCSRPATSPLLSPSQVFQTGDLGNLARLDYDAAAKVPTLMALKSTLYSDEMRSFMREVTGCGELSDKIDCSCNVYANGGHLLCHDDVIGE